jgi:hypothetical protein
VKGDNRQAAIGAIAIKARVDAIALRYASLCDWAVHQPLGCSQAMSWPDQIKVLAVSVSEPIRQEDRGLMYDLRTGASPRRDGGQCTPDGPDRTAGVHARRPT